MKKLKRLLAGSMAIIMTFAFVGCSDSEDTEDASSVKEETVKVVSTDDIEDIPDGAETELLYMGESDLNPTNSNEKSVGLNLFEDKGGTITYSRVTSSNKFTKLGAAVTSGKDVPDLFDYEWLAFPCQVVQGFYQPITDLIDFDDAMWVDVKETASQYQLNGEYYVAPISYNASSMLFYNRDFFTDSGLDDPVDLYYAGEWDIDAMEELMSEWCKGSTEDTIRYGINGYFALQIIQQTGETMVTTEDNITFTNNLDSAAIAKAQERLYNWQKDGYVEPNWIGGASDAFEKNILFYAMGDWAATGTAGPGSSDNWGVVPFPSDPSYEGDKPITTSDMTAYMWVNGSDKSEAVKTFYECYRVAETDTTYIQNTKDKWLADNPYWTEEDYEIIRTVADPDENFMIFDPAYGVSSLMGDDWGGFRTGVNLTGWLYTGCTKADETDGVSYTWTQLKETYSGTVDSELESINSQIESFIASNS
ncbi:MAG: ABC transporter substrate-binding protein [Ruminococcus sp.]|nr:ABC transporter substrate-binding protein [Ruminococcus sp.]